MTARGPGARNDAIVPRGLAIEIQPSQELARPDAFPRSCRQRPAAAATSRRRDRDATARSSQSWSSDSSLSPSATARGTRITGRPSPSAHAPVMPLEVAVRPPVAAVASRNPQRQARFARTVNGEEVRFSRPRARQLLAIRSGRRRQSSPIGRPRRPRRHRDRRQHRAPAARGLCRFAP